MTYKEMVLAELKACVECGIYKIGAARRAAAFLETEDGKMELAEYEQNGARVSDATDLIVQLAR